MNVYGHEWLNKGDSFALEDFHKKEDAPRKSKTTKLKFSTALASDKASYRLFQSVYFSNSLQQQPLDPAEWSFYPLILISICWNNIPLLSLEPLHLWVEQEKKVKQTFLCSKKHNCLMSSIHFKLSEWLSQWTNKANGFKSKIIFWTSEWMPAIAWLSYD